MNSCTFVGRIGKDAETRYTQGGSSATGFPLAVDSGYGDRKQTIWLDCTIWGERGERIAEYLRKGAQVTVIGEIGTREYEGKTYITMRVSELALPPKGDSERRNAPRSEQREAPRQARKPEPAQSAFDDDFQDDIPF